MTIFTQPWLETFIENWNHSTMACASMRGAALVRFVKVDQDDRLQFDLFWDNDGHVVWSRNSDLDEHLPSFTAPTRNWLAFLRGELEAKKAVMTRKIKYSGSLRFATKYGDSFNWIPRISRLGSDSTP